jgi:four helix bundle protein
LLRYPLAPLSAIRYPLSAKPPISLERLADCGPPQYTFNIQDFRNLEVWHAAKDLATAVYAQTQEFPRSELFGLTGQIRRAAVSVASNIAEGSQRSGDAEFARFVGYARGSAAELCTQLVISTDIGLIPEETSRALLHRLERIRMMLQKLHQALTSKNGLSSRSPIAEGLADGRIADGG